MGWPRLAVTAFVLCAQYVTKGKLIAGYNPELRLARELRFLNTAAMSN